VRGKHGESSSSVRPNLRTVNFLEAWIKRRMAVRNTSQPQTSENTEVYEGACTTAFRYTGETINPLPIRPNFGNESPGMVPK
jgi:hypothetical protein